MIKIFWLKNHFRGAVFFSEMKNITNSLGKLILPE